MQVLRLLEHDRPRLSRSGARVVSVTESVAELVVDQVPAIGGQGALVRVRAVLPRPCVQHHHFAIAARQPSASREWRTQAVCRLGCGEQDADRRVNRDPLQSACFDGGPAATVGQASVDGSRDCRGVERQPDLNLGGVGDALTSPANCGHSRGHTELA